MLRRKKRQRIIATVVLGVILFVVSSLSILFGSVFLSPGETLNTLWCGFTTLCSVDNNVFINVLVWQVRLPRIFCAAFVGLLLALSGTILSGAFRNALADPYVLGGASGAGAGAVLAIGLGLTASFLGLSLVYLLAFIFALLALGFVYLISHIFQRLLPYHFILAGMGVASFFTALMVLFILFFGYDHNLLFWLFGGLSNANWDVVLSLLPFVILGLAAAYFYSKDLNALLMGEEMAFSLGVEVEKIRLIMLVLAALLTAVAVSTVGMIGFIGIIAPFFVRKLVGPHYRLLVPLAAILGMLIMVILDTISRTIMPPNEIPIGILSILFGVPFFIYILRENKGLQ